MSGRIVCDTKEKEVTRDKREHFTMMKVLKYINI